MASTTASSVGPPDGSAPARAEAGLGVGESSMRRRMRNVTRMTRSKSSAPESILMRGTPHDAPAGAALPLRATSERLHRQELACAQDDDRARRRAPGRRSLPPEKR